MAFSIDPGTHLGPVHLAVSDLDRSLAFYRDAFGLLPLARNGEEVGVGAESRNPLLLLAGPPEAVPRPAQTTGLYHFALLLPSRKELAQTLRHLSGARNQGLGAGGRGSAAGTSFSQSQVRVARIQGAADHLVSEALYLSDPDGIGIEIYADRPRGEWPSIDGKPMMATDPLDVEGLMAELEGDEERWRGFPAATRVGHVHLQVSDLDRADGFYHGVLGFDRVSRFGPSALFLSAGGYHHHIGLNTWESRGAPPPPADSVGLRYFTVCLPNATELEIVKERLSEAGIRYEETAEGVLARDPSGNGVLLSLGCGRI